MWDHLKTAKAVHDKQLKLMDTRGSFAKTRVLSAILKAGMTPIVYKVKQGMTETAAVTLETQLIGKADQEFPGMLVNIRTNAWLSTVKRKSSSRKGLTSGNVGTLANTRRYYDTERRCHHVLTDKEYKRLVKAGELNPDRLVDMEDYRKSERAAKLVNPMKSRAGSMNGMYGKQSRTLGRRWHTVDGEDKLIFPEDAKKLARKGHTVAVGRAKFKTALFGRGRRIIFEGEPKGAYRSDDYISANPRRKYQLGLIWAPEKPTYRNHKLLKDTHVEARPRARAKD